MKSHSGGGGGGGAGETQNLFIPEGSAPRSKAYPFILIP